MEGRRLVKNIRYDSFNMCNRGTCPHCGREIDDYGLKGICSFCNNQIVWNWDDLTPKEKAIEKEAFYADTIEVVIGSGKIKRDDLKKFLSHYDGVPMPQEVILFSVKGNENSAADIFEKCGFSKIIRCKDCKHFQTAQCSMDDSHFELIEENGFCSFAEKKD